ncbi:MAG: phosphate acyltransferase [Porticoccaceae bacterium]|nr:MAG: phosphate acyltransferase [Porticoccaceae bacterium]
MGGDGGPAVAVGAVVDALERWPSLFCELHGRPDVLEPLLRGVPHPLRERLAVEAAPDVVAMGERPARALRNGRNSSLWRALEALAEERVDGCVSGGNTGALLLIGVKLIGTFPGIERPALCTALPTAAGRAHLLDMGANLDCDAELLWQFARMGSALAAATSGVPSPRVGLLNVGSEAEKGDAVVREAAALLEADARINYCGFVEGDGIFSGRVDVVVCDGFAGNVAIKAAEGVAQLVGGMLRSHLARTPRARLGAWVARPALAALLSRLDPAKYNGGSLLGLRRTVVKSRGNASRAGLCNAIGVALAEVERKLPERIHEALAA